MQEIIREMGEATRVTVLLDSETQAMILPETIVKPSDDPEITLAKVGEKLAAEKIDDDWREQEKLLTDIICLARFHSPLLRSITSLDLFTILRELSESLRSAVAKNAFLALSEVFSNCSFLLQSPSMVSEDEFGNWSEFRKLVSCISLKCVSEKKFLADAAQVALEKLAAADIPRSVRKEVFQELLWSASSSKNIRLTGIMTTSALNCLKTDPDVIRELNDLGKEVMIVLELESGKSTTARTPAQGILREVQKTLGDLELNSIFDELNLNSVVRKRVDEILKDGKQAKTSGSLSKPWKSRSTNSSTN